MKIMNSTKTKHKAILCFVFLLSNCTVSNEPFSVMACDNFDSELHCLEPKTDKETIVIDSKVVPFDINWKDFGNYLYFKAKETPGILIERKNIPKENFRPSLFFSQIEWDGTIQHMEGKRSNPNRIASFHYLGSLIKENAIQKGRENQPFRWKDPMVLQIRYSLGKDLKGELVREINWMRSAEP